MSLRQHQAEGAKWLAPRARAILGDAPRRGKTRTVLWGAHLAGAKQILVVCPAMVRTHWRREAEALGLGHLIAHVMSYDGIVQASAEKREKLIEKEGIDTLILDEAHYLKHAESKRTRMILGKDGYARRIPRVWACTGTLMPKHPGEAWNLLSTFYPASMLDAGCRTFDDFVERFCTFLWEDVRVGNRWVRKRRITGLKDAAGLQQLLQPLVLRREPGADVPTLDWQVIPLDQGERHFIDPETQRRVEEALHGDALAAVVADPYVAAMRRKVGEVKAPVAAALLADMVWDDPTLKVAVFAYHRDVLEILRARLQEAGLVYVDGDTSPAKRQAAMDAFQTDPAVRVFLGQSKACETGITLSAATVAAIVEPDWTAENNVQLGNRIADEASPVKRVVQMYALAGTLDEAIVARNRREARMLRESGWNRT